MENRVATFSGERQKSILLLPAFRKQRFAQGLGKDVGISVVKAFRPFLDKEMGVYRATAFRRIESAITQLAELYNERYEMAA